MDIYIGIVIDLYRKCMMKLTVKLDMNVVFYLLFSQQLLTI